MKILLLPGPYGISHASRMLQIARELQSYGCQFKASITKEQRVLPWGEIPRTEIPEIPKTKSAEEAFYGVASYELLQRHLEQELNLIHSFQPDFILADLRLTAAISSRITNTPLITIQNASMIKSFDPHGIAKDRNVQDLTKNRDQITVIPAFKKLANQNGLQHLTSLFDVLSGDLQWICDLEELFPIKNLMPHQSFIGPLIFEQEDSINQLPATFPKRENEVLIYITIGNTGGKELIPKFIKAFGGDSFCKVIITTGKNNPIGIPTPSNIFITPYVNGPSVLPHADVIIHHGGSGSMYQAMKYQKPVVTIPYNPEQLLNAMVIENTETGIVLNWRTVTPEKILEKTRKVFQYRALLSKNGEAISQKINQPLDVSLLMEQLKAHKMDRTFA